MKEINWVIPFETESKAAEEYLFHIAQTFEKLTECKLNFHRKETSGILVEQVSEIENVIAPVSTYEAAYLQSAFKFFPFFRLVFSSLDLIVAVQQDSKISRLDNLKGKKVAFPRSSDMMLLNPVIQFLLKHAIIYYPKNYSPFLIGSEASTLRDLIDNKVEAALGKDPKGQEGKRLAHEWQSLFDQMYGDQPELKAALRKAYKEDRIEHRPFSKEVFEWIETATDYWIRNKDE